MKFQNSKNGSNIVDVKTVPFLTSLVTTEPLVAVVQYLMMISQGNNVDNFCVYVLTIYFYDKNL